MTGLKGHEGMRDGAPYRRIAYGLAGAVFLSTLGVGVFTFAIPLFALHDAVSGLMLGAAFSGYFLAKLAVSPLAGLCSDKTGSRPLLIAAALLGILAPLAALLSREREILYAVQFCLGLSAGILKPVATAAIAEAVPIPVRGRMFGMCNALYNAAFFLAPMLGGLLFYDRDLLPVLIFLSASMAVSLVLIQAVAPKSLSAGSHGRGRGSGAGQGGSLRSGTLMLAVCGRTAGTACLIVFYPILLTQTLHGPAWLVGLLFAVPSLAACLGLPLCGRLADRCNHETLIVAGMAVSSASLALAGRMETAPGFLAVGVILGLGSSLSFPAAMALAASLGSRQGTIMGWFHAAANGGFVIGPLVCGLLVERYGEISLPMGVMGAMGLVSVLPLALVGLVTSKAVSWRTLASAALAVIIAAGALTIHGGLGGGTGQTSPVSVEPLNFAGVAMGNVVHMTLHGAEDGKGGEDSKAAFKLISRLEKDFGHRNGGGSVGRVNMAAGRAPEPVSRAAFDLIRRALDICRASSGTFDITIGAVTALPSYYREKAAREKASLVDYRKVVVDEARQTVYLPEAGMALDLGGLAKGTILDSAARMLRDRGVPAALVEAGGDLSCYGDREWKVGIQDPRGDGLLGVISVANVGVCGSGDYFQFALVQDGGGATRRRHHILDPASLDSADKSIAVTVVAPNAELADALATTLFILGPDEGRVFLERYENCSALWVLPDTSIVASKTFPPLSQ